MSGRRMGHRRFKGPVFPSHRYSKLDTSQKLQWNAHTGTRAQLRNLQHKCRHLLGSQDPAIKEMGARVIEAVKDEPNPEFGALHLIAAAVDASNETGEPWLTCMEYFLKKFQEMANG